MGFARKREKREVVNSAVIICQSHLGSGKFALQDRFGFACNSSGFPFSFMFEPNLQARQRPCEATGCPSGLLPRCCPLLSGREAVTSPDLRP